MTENTDLKKKNFMQEQFAKIDGAETARKFAKEGAIAGVILTLMEIGGAVFAYYGQDPVTGDAMSADATFDQIIGAVILTPILLFMSWRIKTGKGYVSASLLLLLFLVEVFAKIANGTTNGGWVLFYFFIIVAFVNGIRGCWYLRGVRKQESRQEKSEVADF